MRSSDKSIDASAGCWSRDRKASMGSIQRLADGQHLLMPRHLVHAQIRYPLLRQELRYRQRRIVARAHAGEEGFARMADEDGDAQHFEAADGAQYDQRLF